MIEEIKNALAYDPETGIFHWKIYRAGTARAGDKAGVRKKRGWIEIQVFGKRYKAAVLAWAIMTGEWPSLEVDHVNTVRDDDRWENLRLATRQQNCINRRSVNEYGLKGVQFLRRCTKRPWKARIMVNGEHINLGFYATKEEAHEAYCRGAAKYHGEFANTRSVRPLGCDT